MKKRIVGLLLAAMLLTLCGCGVMEETATETTEQGSGEIGLAGL